MAKLQTDALRAFNHKLKKLSNEKLAISIAQESSPKLTELAQSAFASGKTVYGDPRPAGKSGPVSLVQSGSLRRSLKFSNRGTNRIMARMADIYTSVHKHFGYLPYVNDTLPFTWSQAIKNVFLAHMQKDMEG